MMDSPNSGDRLAELADIPESKPARDLDKWGLILRLLFFAFLFYSTGFLAPLLYYMGFGKVVSGTIPLCMGGLVANWLTMRIFDSRPFSDIGLEGGGLSARNFFTGTVFGGGTAALMLLMPILGGAGHLVPKDHSDFQWTNMIFYLLAILLASGGEEMIFRGYAFQILIEKVGPYATVLPVAVFFGLLHSWNPHASGLAIFNTILWGVILGYAFVRSHDLWLPIGLHFGWNAVLPFFGVNLSGIPIDLTRYQYQWDVSPLWSGGAYGPEGGLLTTIFGVGVFFALLRTPIKAQIARIAVSLNEVDPLSLP